MILLVHQECKIRILFPKIRNFRNYKLYLFTFKVISFNFQHFFVDKNTFRDWTNFLFSKLLSIIWTSGFSKFVSGITTLLDDGLLKRLNDKFFLRRSKQSCWHSWVSKFFWTLKFLQVLTTNGQECSLYCSNILVTFRAWKLIINIFCVKS